MGIKHKIDIERLLQWAYRDELPKQFAAGPSLLADLAMLGAPIDRGQSDHGRMPLAAGPPHPDALMLEYYVRALPAVRVNWRGQREYLMGELAPYLDRDDPITSAMATGPVVDVELYRSRSGGTRARTTVRRKAGLVKPVAESAAALVTLHARMGTRPEWHMPIGLAPVMADNHKPTMIGRQIRKNLYTAGSYCPLRLAPPAQEVACARFEYMVWHQALVAIAQQTRGVLQDHEATAPAAAAAPWLTGPEKVSRVLAGKVTHDGRRLLVKPSRETTLRQTPAARSSPVRKLDPKTLTTRDEGG